MPRMPHQHQLWCIFLLGRSLVPRTQWRLDDGTWYFGIVVRPMWRCWMTEQDICEWRGVDCDENSSVPSILSWEATNWWDPFLPKYFPCRSWCIWNSIPIPLKWPYVAHGSYRELGMYGLSSWLLCLHGRCFMVCHYFARSTEALVQTTSSNLVS